MKRAVLLPPILLALALPASAQDTESEAPSLMERGAQLFFEGLLKEMEPALNDLEGLAEDMEPAWRDFSQRVGPAWADLMGKVDDFNRYELPEVLDNGDIIIRRKPEAAPKGAEEAVPEADIEI